ncbi:hypothetical protein LZ32DRAFT_300787 [Colletotrichum eremochloae]|nr:hypothetical protein LZ32DRAFT_300787 [Colletotrichum eremochloae]
MRQPQQTKNTPSSGVHRGHESGLGMTTASVTSALGIIAIITNQPTNRVLSRGPNTPLAATSDSRRGVQNSPSHDLSAHPLLGCKTISAAIVADYWLPPTGKQDLGNAYHDPWGIAGTRRNKLGTRMKRLQEKDRTAHNAKRIPVGVDMSPSTYRPRHQVANAGWRMGG